MNQNTDSDFIATHVHPAWREKADYVFRCKIDSDDGQTEWEQMWGKTLEKDIVMVCCIPFFMYNLSLGDVVKIDKNDEFYEILEKSGNCTVRLWTANADTRTKNDFITEAFKLSDYAEMHSADLFALSVNNNRSAEVWNFLNRETEKSGIIYEIADG